MTLRDDIATYTFTYWDDFADGGLSHPELMRTSVRMTNHILALIRESLLSDEAVEACLLACHGCGGCETYENKDGACDQSCKRQNKAGLAAALDAITGEPT